MEEQTTQEPEQPALPDMEIYQIVEGMTPEQRVDYKRQLLDGISDREVLCRIIDEVNEAEGSGEISIIY